MCNIAGYIGNRRAAPILLEMMSRESGFGGGYYTGIATMHEGKLHYAKVAGDLDKLLSDTNAMELPGNIGFIHSRSRGDQDVEWAHPFISDDGKLAYIANGSAGVLEDKALSARIADELREEGFIFRTAREKFDAYITMSNDKTIHVSELVAHMIAKNYRECGDMNKAMMKAMTDRPSEIVGLTMHTDYPDRIFIARFNMPMMIAKTQDETFLGTTAMAFPDDREYQTTDPIPCIAMSEVTVDGYKVTAFDPVPMRVNTIDSRIWHDAYNIVVKELKTASKTEPLSVGKLIRATDHLWDNTKLCQRAMLIYEILRALGDKVKIVKVIEQGPAQGILTTQFRMYMEE